MTEKTEDQHAGRDVIGEVIEEDRARAVPPSVAQHALETVPELKARIEEQAREIERLSTTNKALIHNHNLHVDQLAALKARQSGGVRMPERMEVKPLWRDARDPTPGTEVNKLQIAEARAHNTALDEVARLNSSLLSAGVVDERADLEKRTHDILMRCLNNPHTFRHQIVSDDELCDVIEARAALTAATPSHGEHVREGWMQVPKSMLLEANSLEALVFVGGGVTGDDGAPTYLDCALWVGDLLDDDGKAIHGLHAYCTECEEEGSTTLAEFAAALAASAEGKA